MGANVEIDVDENIARGIDLNVFAEKIKMKVWTRLARLSWQSYQEAAEFVRSLDLKNSYEWQAYCRGERPDLPKRPFDIPVKPHRVYGADFVIRGGMSAWLGAGRRTRGWRPYNAAKFFVQTLGLKTGDEWGDYCRGKRKDLPPKPADIPMRPEAVYKNDYESMGKWLGSGNLSNLERKWRSYSDAVKFARSLHISNKKAWARYVRGELAGFKPCPIDIPATPHHVYKEFKSHGGWGHWLGNPHRRGGWRPYHEAREFARSLKLKNGIEWWKYCKGKMAHLPKKPLDVPTNAKDVYGTEYKSAGGMSAWLGTKQEWRPYSEAIAQSTQPYYISTKY